MYDHHHAGKVRCQQASDILPSTTQHTIQVYRIRSLMEYFATNKSPESISQAQRNEINVTTKWGLILMVKLDFPKDVK